MAEVPEPSATQHNPSKKENHVYIKGDKRVRRIPHLKNFESAEHTYIPSVIKDTYSGEFWHNLDGKKILVRQKGYYDAKQLGEGGKAPSISQLYDTVDFAKFGVKAKEMNPTKMLDLPFDKDWNRKIKLPQFLILNAIVPVFEPGIFSTAMDGQSKQVVVVAELREDAKQRWITGNTTEADKLLYRYLYDPNENGEDEFNIRHRLKAVVTCSSFDPDENEFSIWLQVPMNTYNGTYVVLKRSPSFYVKENFAIINIDINHFGRFTKKCMYACSARSAEEVMDFSMMIEGHAQDDSELPEMTILSLRLRCDCFDDVREGS